MHDRTPDNPQAEPPRVGESTVRRYLDHQRDVIIASADLSSMFAAYLDHVRRWENAIDDLSYTFMRQGLGAATLHLSCRPRGEIVGWTINIRQPPTNIFLTGDSGDAIVTGRIFTDNVKTFATSRMFVQISKPGKEPSQSTVEVNGIDIFEIFEQYYDQSEQTPARFFEITDQNYLMVHGLPEVDVPWLQDLSREEAVELTTGELKSLGETTYRYQCGCSPTRIMDLMLEIYRQQPAELFRDDAEVEVLCPRCGRRWWIKRDEFEGAAGAGED